MPAAYKYYYRVISEPQTGVGLSRAWCPAFGSGLWVLFVLGCWGFAPRRSQRNGNPSSGAPGCSVKQKEVKQRGKKWKKKYLPRLFLFENLLYLKYKIITFEFPINFLFFFFLLVVSIPSCWISWLAFSLPVPHFNFTPLVL